MTTSTIKVLLVEDDDVDRESIHRLLDDQFEVIDAVTGAYSLMLCEKHRPDCVLLDQMLPDITGLEVLNQLTQTDSHPAIVFVSGSGGLPVAIEALKHGAHDFLVKGSFNEELLSRAIHNALDKVALEHRIADKHEALERFAHVVAHDLQEPLRGIVGMAQMLKDERADKDEQTTARWIDEIIACTNRMQHMIDDLLDYTHVDHDDTKREPVDCVEVLAEVKSNLSRTIEDSSATITNDDLPTVSANHSQLLQLFQNLIANAIKYRGDAAPRIHISAAQADENQWQFSVRDNGIGIDPKQHQRIFTIFQQLHARGKYAGDGVGLAICKKIIELHRGKIWVESDVGEGSTFHFTMQA